MHGTSLCCSGSQVQPPYLNEAEASALFSIAFQFVLHDFEERNLKSKRVPADVAETRLRVVGSVLELIVPRPVGNFPFLRSVHKLEGHWPPVSCHPPAADGRTNPPGPSISVQGDNPLNALKHGELPSSLHKLTFHHQAGDGEPESEDLFLQSQARVAGRLMFKFANSSNIPLAQIDLFVQMAGRATGHLISVYNLSSSLEGTDTSTKLVEWPSHWPITKNVTYTFKTRVWISADPCRGPPREFSKKQLIFQ